MRLETIEMARQDRYPAKCERTEMTFIMEGTVRIGVTEYRLRPPVHEIHMDRPAVLEGKFVVPCEEPEGEPWERCDHLPDCPGPELDCEDCPWHDDRPIVRTWDIEAVVDILDGDGTVVGYICPGCGSSTLLEEAIWLAQRYRRCTTPHCDTLVDCGVVLTGL